MKHLAGSSLGRSGHECGAYCMGIEDRMRYFGMSLRDSGRGECVTKVRVKDVMQGKWSEGQERVVYTVNFWNVDDSWGNVA